MPPAPQSGDRKAGSSRRRAGRKTGIGQRSKKMNLSRRHFLVLLPAAALAWDHVLAGAPEAAPGYNTADHWWGMLIDIEKCIGCGSCVRACQKENNVPDGYYRTW